MLFFADEDPSLSVACSTSHLWLRQTACINNCLIILLDLVNLVEMISAETRGWGVDACRWVMAGGWDFCLDWVVWMGVLY